MRACFGFLHPNARGRTARSLAATVPAAVLSGWRMAVDLEAVAGRAAPGEPGALIAMNGAASVLSVTALALSVAARQRPDDEPAAEGRDDYYVRRGLFTKGSGKTSAAEILVQLVRTTLPRGPRHKALAAGALASMLLVRFINLAVPWAFSRLVDRLAGAPAAPAATDAARFEWILVPTLAVYLAVCFAQGGAGGSDFGLLSNLRKLCMIPIKNATYRRNAHAMFAKLVGLDLTWHLGRQTGKVVETVNRGLDATQFLIGNVLMYMAPAMLDIALACAYLASQMEPWVGAILALTMACYLPLTVVVTEKSTKYRRRQNRLANERSARMTDTLLNYENVKLFTTEAYEEDAYMEVVDEFLSDSARMDRTYALLNLLQGSVVFSGTAAGLLLVAWGVARGTQTVGDAVLFFSLMGQVVSPLTWLGGTYRYALRCLTDAESMIELLGTLPSLEDAPGAADLAVTDGELEFEGVTFYYEARRDAPKSEGRPRGTRHLAAGGGAGAGEVASARTPLLAGPGGDGGGEPPPAAPGPETRLLALDGVSFRVGGGKKLALVGATGSGKSTILRLIFRFYDPHSGAIRLDGQDLREVTQLSLRRAVGVVPQDMVLFNDTIRHNIMYGRLDATGEEVEAAADAACIGDHIRGRFPEGFETVVGERGLRLSGGEKQRVAFARALLKRPRVLVLDEATSALDSITERSIQRRLAELPHRVTQVVVAHRLSTIVDADLVVVLSHGRVVETGTHAGLVRQGGMYAKMWNHQAQHGSQGDFDRMVRDIEGGGESP